MKHLPRYASRRAMQQRTAAFKAATQANAQSEDKLREAIIADVRSLQVDAGIHAWTGDDARKMINLSGRLVYLVAFAANQAGFDADHVDMRILRGMANALGDFAADLGHIERYRGSIQSGLQAIARLLPNCDNMHLLLGAAALEGQLDLTRGMGTQDVRLAMGMAA